MLAVHEVPEGLRIRGAPKRNWAKHKALVELIFVRWFPCWNRFMGQKLVAAGIPKSTLYDWMKQFTRDPSWRPYHCLRSRSKRIFTDEEEHAIADYIVAVYISRGVYFSEVVCIRRSSRALEQFPAYRS